MLLTERYYDKISGELSCYDRVVIQGTLPDWCYDQGMTTFLHMHKIKIFDFPDMANKLRLELRDNAELLAKENDLDIEFIRKINGFRKEARIKEIVRLRGPHPGLVHIFSAMETCHCYKPNHNKNTGKTSLVYAGGKCLHYYFYFIDKEFGLCYLRVPTWAPFRLQFYFNGHNWLAGKLDKAAIAYAMIENAFVTIADYDKAQALSDGFRVDDLKQALDIFAARYCPVITQYKLAYHWGIMQAEYATDIIFTTRDALRSIYEPLIRNAIHSVKPENIATFLGKKLHPNFQGEMGNNLNTRIEGTRIKHQMGASAIKMYDKFGQVLRIETTTNDVSQFKHYREVQHRDGSTEREIAPMKKGIYSLFPLSKVLKAANRRYLEFISSFDDISKGICNLEKVSRTVATEKRTYKGFNFFAAEDVKLLLTLERGEFNINGFQNKTLHRYLSDKSSGQISRILKRLNKHGIIKKIGRTYKYYLTSLGKAVIAAGQMIKEMSIIPHLARV
jgi:hypothetical protein